MMDTLTGQWGAKEIAMGIAFGILLGLLPKTNLLFAIFAILFFLSHANIVIGIVITVIVAFLSPFYYPVADQIGRNILISASGQQILGLLFKLPLFPWTMLDNTVVFGTFLTGLILFFPVFFLVWIPLNILLPKRITEPVPPKNR